MALPQVRTLKKKDQEKLSKMLFKMMEIIKDDSLSDIIKTISDGQGSTADDGSTADNRAKLIKIFVKLFEQMFVVMSTEVDSFFADLCGVTVEEYLEYDIDIDVYVLENVLSQQGVEHFFSGPLRMFKGTPWLSRMFQGLKEKYDSLTS